MYEVALSTEEEEEDAGRGLPAPVKTHWIGLDTGLVRDVHSSKRLCILKFYVVVFTFEVSNFKWSFYIVFVVVVLIFVFVTYVSSRSFTT